MTDYLERYLQKVPKEKTNKAAIAFLASLDYISEKTPLVSQAILQELLDQRHSLKLIASENYASLAVQLAMGNLLTDKYAEGFSGHRFYAGCENVDTLETDAENTLKDLFQAEHAYVQPHSGADANLVAYWSILVQRVQDKELQRLEKKNLDELSLQDRELIRLKMLQQKMMGLSLNSGGHLTHGFSHNVSSKMMRAVPYEVDPKTEQLDYKVLEKQVLEEKPDILVAGYSAHPCRLNFAILRAIADRVGAVLMVDMAHFAGLVAGKVFTGDYNPIPFAHLVTSTTHKTLRGPRGGFILCKKEFAETVNKGCPLVLGGPLPHVIAAKAIAFKEASTKEFQIYAKQIVENAKALAKTFLDLGVRLVSGGTENHLLIVDVSSFQLTGRQAEIALRKAKITANRNAIPFDSNGAWYTSGIRLGPAALTTRGLKQEEMKEIASIIVEVLKNTKASLVAKTGQLSKANAVTDETVLERAKARVDALLQKFPLYPEIILN